MQRFTGNQIAKVCASQPNAFQDTEVRAAPAAPVAPPTGTAVCPDLSACVSEDLTGQQLCRIALSWGLRGH